MRSRSFLVLLGWIWFSVAANAQKYAVTERIPFGGEQTYWDYLLADAPGHHLYVTRGNEVLILDLSSAKEVASIRNLKRVHGVALARELNKGFISDGGTNAVVVFDLKSNSVTQAIKVGNAPDAVLYEPTKKRIYAFNAHSHTASVIEAATGKIVATVPLSGIPEFAVTDGKGNVFVNIENKNSLVRFDADGTKVQNEWSVGALQRPVWIGDRCEEPSAVFCLRQQVHDCYRRGHRKTNCPDSCRRRTGCSDLRRGEKARLRFELRRHAHGGEARESR